MSEKFFGKRNRFAKDLKLTKVNEKNSQESFKEIIYVFMSLSLHICPCSEAKLQIIRHKKMQGLSMR